VPPPPAFSAPPPPVSHPHPPGAGPAARVGRARALAPAPSARPARPGTVGRRDDTPPAARPYSFPAWSSREVSGT